MQSDQLEVGLNSVLHQLERAKAVDSHVNVRACFMLFDSQRLPDHRGSDDGERGPICTVFETGEPDPEWIFYNPDRHSW